MGNCRIITIKLIKNAASLCGVWWRTGETGDSFRVEGVSCLFKLEKLNVNLLRLFIDKNLGLELKCFKLKFF
nr:MAG TPA: hypothetical protein [Siphoviridae sp. ctngg6]